LRRSPCLSQSSGYASQWIIGSPRISHPSALPCLNLRVAPFPRSSGNASDQFSPSFPGHPRSSGSAKVPFPGSPRFLVPRPRLRPAFKVALDHRPLALPLPASPGFPEPCMANGWSMMTPRLDSNFASAAEPWMNLRLNRVLHVPTLALLVLFSTSILTFHSPSRPGLLPVNIQPVSCTVLPSPRTAFPFPPVRASSGSVS